MAVRIFLSSTFSEFRIERKEIGRLAGILDIVVSPAEDWGDIGKEKEETLTETLH